VDVKELCNIMKKLSRKGFRENKPARNNRGEILSTQYEQLKRWREYFSEILNKNVWQKVQEEGVLAENIDYDQRINLQPPNTHRNDVSTKTD
jgi:hypothetical protein